MKSINIKNEYKEPEIDWKYWSKIYTGKKPSSKTNHGDPKSTRNVNCTNCLQRKRCKYK